MSAGRRIVGKARMLPLVSRTQRELNDPLAEGFVYFVRCETTSRIKIGWSIDPDRRLADFQTICPTRVRIIKAVRARRWQEKILHSDFSHCRVHGEWFEGTPELLAFIREFNDDRSADLVLKQEITEQPPEPAPQASSGAKAVRDIQKILAATVSQYKGLTWIPAEKRWKVRIFIDGRSVSLGRFKDEVEAAHAYDDAARRHRGQKARLNFPIGNFADGPEDDTLRCSDCEAPICGECEGCHNTLVCGVAVNDCMPDEDDEL